jgi:hypothetical protein
MSKALNGGGLGEGRGDRALMGRAIDRILSVRAMGGDRMAGGRVWGRSIV